MGIFDWLFGGKKTINKDIARKERQRKDWPAKNNYYKIPKKIKEDESNEEINEDELSEEEQESFVKKYTSLTLYNPIFVSEFMKRFKQAVKGIDSKIPQNITGVKQTINAPIQTKTIEITSQSGPSRNLVKTLPLALSLPKGLSEGATFSIYLRLPTLSYSPARP